MRQPSDYMKFLEAHSSLVDSKTYPLREIIEGFSCRVKPGRALAKLGLKRKRVDRLLSRKQTLDMELYVLIAALLDDLEAVAFEQDSLARERVFQAVERLYPSQEPPEVAVEISGPSWLDCSLWLPPSRRVKTRQARWLLQNLDGLAVGGETLQVTCEPTIRRGRIPPRREPDAQRKRRLFSRWFQGIRVDEEGLFSLTPEALALDMTAGLSGRVVDGTCGVGALSIAAARQPEVSQVWAIDCDERRLEMARHNAALYGVDRRMEFVRANVQDWIVENEADWLLLDPPWGGTEYNRKEVGLSDIAFPLTTMIGLFSGGIRIKLPRSFRVSELPPSWACRPAIDDRGILKFLILERDPL